MSRTDKGRTRCSGLQVPPWGWMGLLVSGFVLACAEGSPAGPDPLRPGTLVGFLDGVPWEGPVETHHSYGGYLALRAGDFWADGDAWLLGIQLPLPATGEVELVSGGAFLRIVAVAGDTVVYRPEASDTARVVIDQENSAGLSGRLYLTFGGGLHGFRQGTFTVYFP